MSIFIRMKDTFMSGWGGAEGKTNLYVIECASQEQADQIVAAAEQRGEMTRIRQVAHAPQNTRHQVVSLKQFADLGEIWTGGVAA